MRNRILPAALASCSLAIVCPGPARGEPPAGATSSSPAQSAGATSSSPAQSAGAGAAPAGIQALSVASSTARDADQTVDKKRDPSDDGSGWVLLPAAAYTPDRGFFASAAALHYFRAPGGGRPEESVHGAPTGDRQGATSRLVLSVEGSASGRGMVNFDPNVWFDGGRLNLGGTAWVGYLDYPYFGIGNDTRMEDREDYTALRVTARPELVRRIAPDLYGGGLYEFRYEEVLEVEAGGELDAGGAKGSDGGVASGVGLILRWDSRDHAFAPRSGGLVTLSPRVYHQILGSDFDFTRLLLEASWFFGLGGAHVLAVDGQVDLRGGDPSFSHMSQAGGRRLLRGMLEGRRRDRHFLGGQIEYRFPLWWRFGGVAFGGLGRVAHRISDFGPTGLAYSAGGGLRFALRRDERIHVRLDAGKSNDDFAFYFALLEAF